MDYPGQPFWWPEADQAFVDALKKHLRPDIPVEISDKDVNHPEFASRTAEKLLEFLGDITGNNYGNTTQRDS
jgi:uncharacterized protein (UPF0261 family)